MAGGSPLAALEPSADDRLSAKTENAVLEFLRAGPELSVDALVRLYAPISRSRLSRSSCRAGRTI